MYAYIKSHYTDDRTISTDISCVSRDINKLTKLMNEDIELERAGYPQVYKALDGYSATLIGEHNHIISLQITSVQEL